MLKAAPDVTILPFESGFLVSNPRTGTVMCANHIASEIWRGIEEGRTRENIVSDLASKYGQPESKVAGDFDNFVQQMIDNDLAERVQTDEPATNAYASDNGVKEGDRVVFPSMTMGEFRPGRLVKIYEIDSIAYGLVQLDHPIYTDGGNESYHHVGVYYTALKPEITDGVKFTKGMGQYEVQWTYQGESTSFTLAYLDARGLRQAMKTDKIWAIKMFRLLTGAGLKQAKDIVEALEFERPENR